MPWPLYAGTARPAAAETQVINPRALDHDLGDFFRARPLGIGCDVFKTLLDQRVVAKCSAQAELPRAPFHHGREVAPGGSGEAEFDFGRPLRHAYFWRRAFSSR